VFDNLPLAAAALTLDLHLLENTRRKHVLLDLNAMAPALSTGIDFTVRGAGTFALFANLLLL
jgi:hypothetical protein